MLMTSSSPALREMCRSNSARNSPSVDWTGTCLKNGPVVWTAVSGKLTFLLNSMVMSLVDAVINQPCSSGCFWTKSSVRSPARAPGITRNFEGTGYVTVAALFKLSYSGLLPAAFPQIAREIAAGIHVKNGPARFWRYEYPPLRRSQSELMLVLLQQLRLSLKGRFESPLKGFRDASPASSLPGHREWTKRSRKAPAAASSTHEPATSRAFRAANLAANAVIFGSEVDRSCIRFRLATSTSGCSMA